MKNKLTLNPHIEHSETLPSDFYTNEVYFQQSKVKVFERSWQWAAHRNDFEDGMNLRPFDFLPGLLDEPLLLSFQDSGKLRALPNVCTHRAKILVESPCKKSKIICGYHGRRFRKDGQFEFMPGFRECENFPRKEDSLQSLPVHEESGLLFSALSKDAFPANELFSQVRELMYFFPVSKLYEDRSRRRNYNVSTHWALYCENYLEGFHIPFVHPGLNDAVEQNSYETRLSKWGNVQVAYAKDGTQAFDLPEGHPDFGKSVAAYYFWLFPNIMLNFYPWGVSLNEVLPQGLELTKINFYTFVKEGADLSDSAGADLNQTELEDEAVVESVLRGVKSRFYHKGRFSPKHERGVHHFQMLIAEQMNEK